jgi:ATP-binding cassette subfamily B protein
MEMYDLPTTPLRFVLHFLKKRCWLFLTLALLVSIAAMLDTFWPYSTKMIVEAFSSSGSVARQASIVRFSVIYIVVLMTAIILESCKVVLDSHLRAWWHNNVYMAVLVEVQQKSYSFFINNFTGTLVSKIKDLTTGSFEIVKITLSLGNNVFFAISAFFLLYRVHRGMCVLCLVWILLHVLFRLWRMNVWNIASQKASEATNKYIGKITDSLSNYGTVKAFAEETGERKYLTPFLLESQKTRISFNLLLARDHFIIDTLSCWGFYLPSLVLVCFFHKLGFIMVADAAFVLTTMDWVNWRIAAIGEKIVNLSEIYGNISQAMWLLTTPQEVQDTPGATPLKITTAEVSFNSVVFHYLHQKNLLENFNLSIKSGEKVGLVGRSGAGKSTLVNLLLRYFDVLNGSIALNGQDIRTITQESLRRHIAFIPQDTLLFHRTIRENIAYGCPEADDEKIRKVAARAYADKFIEATMDGYNSLVGDKGVKLSVGQRQRIAIARALLKDAPLLVLDEATSALDSETEVKIQKSLEELMQGRTTIAIAHRLSTLRHMDRIVVLDNGRLVEEGDHNELMARGGLYFSLWSMQSNGFIGEGDTES